MEIYKIESDYTYKQFAGKDDATIGKFHHYKGQSLADEWQPPVFVLLETASKVRAERLSEERKNENRDGACHGNIFLLKEKFTSIMQSSPVECLPVIIEGLADKFVFVNVLTILPTINFEGLDYNQSMKMVKDKEIKFSRESIGEHVLFRDQKLINNYYCTEQFSSLIEQHAIKGLHFDKVGTAI